MAARRKKRTSAKTGCLLWIIAFIVLLILFLVKFGDIRAAVQKTGFLDALNHALSKPAATAPSPAKTPVQPQPATKGTSETQQPERQEEPPVASPSASQPELGIPSTPPATQTPQSTSSPAPGYAQEPSTPTLQKKKTRSAVLYFVQIHDDGSIFSERVKRLIPLSDSPIQDTLEILLKGPTEAELRANLLSLIPSGTKLHGVSVRGSTAVVDFSDTFLYNRYGKEGYMAQLRQVVYTLTEFRNITDVQFLIEGKTRTFLTEGVALDKPWARASF